MWSPDSKWVAYSSRLKSLYHAIFIANVETGESKQVTDGLADSVWPAWDASGKYLWFFASTDFGLKSQWLDMTSYDHDENFGLYLAVLKKGEPSPLLPESDEDHGVGSAQLAAAGRRRAGAAAVAMPRNRRQSGRSARPRRLRARRSTCRSISTASSSASSPCQASPHVSTSELRAGVAGTVYYLEAGGRGGGRRRRRQRAAALSPERSPSGAVRHRRAAYDVSADGHKLVYRARRRRRRPRRTRRAPEPAPAGPSLFLVDADRQPPQAGAGRLNVSFACTWSPRKSSSRSSTKAGATSAIISTCPTCTARTGRR